MADELQDFFNEERLYAANPTMLVDHAALTDAAATEMQKVLDSLSGAEMIVDSIVMESIRPTAAQGDYATDGEIRWQLYVRSPYRNAAKGITIPQPVVAGKVTSPRIFIDSAGNIMPLEADVLANYVNMGIRP